MHSPVIRIENLGKKYSSFEAVRGVSLEVGQGEVFVLLGPNGVFIIEPEIGLGEDILVPDLAGWRRERYPGDEPYNWISVAPDWVCEVLSPSTLRSDKIRKMPIYAQYGVPHLWLVDPTARTLDVFRLESGKWLLLESYIENDKVRAEPYQEIEIDLGNLWID